MYSSQPSHKLLMIIRSMIPLCALWPLQGSVGLTDEWLWEDGMEFCLCLDSFYLQTCSTLLTPAGFNPRMRLSAVLSLHRPHFRLRHGQDISCLVFMVFLFFPPFSPLQPSFESRQHPINFLIKTLQWPRIPYTVLPSWYPKQSGIWVQLPSSQVTIPHFGATTSNPG